MEAYNHTGMDMMNSLDLPNVRYDPVFTYHDDGTPSIDTVDVTVLNQQSLSLDKQSGFSTESSNLRAEEGCMKLYRMTVCYIQNCFEDLQSAHFRSNSLVRPPGQACKEVEGKWHEFKERLREWKKCNVTESLVGHDTMRAIISNVQEFLATHSPMLPSGASIWLDCFQVLLKIDLDNMSIMISHIIATPEREKITNLSACQLRAVMNVLQMRHKLIDGQYAYFDILRKFLHKLVKKREILPSRLFISGIRRFGTNPLKGGGFADVWRGEYNYEPVALKVLRIFDQGGLDVKKMHRDFCTEAMIWQTMKHENILPFYGVCEDVFSPQLAMVSPWLENGDLAAFLKCNDQVDRVRMVAGVAQGLHYLHSMKPAAIIHGDLRAGNVLVDENHRARITDFGLTKVLESQGTTLATTSFTGKGSLRWQAPELLGVSRFEGETSQVTSYSDVYAFACLCLEVFTGEVPFSGMRDGAVILAVAVEDKRPLRPTNPATLRGLDDRIWSIMEMCWCTQPEDRPHISEVIALLSAIPS